jgi:hypothetical protein
MKKILAILLVVGITPSLLSQDTTRQKLDELLRAYHDLYKLNGSVLGKSLPY